MGQNWENAMIKRLTLFAFSLLTLSGSAWTADAIGSVVATLGSASASQAGKIRVLKEGDDVFEKDRITVESGNVQLVLRDGTKLVVGPNSTLLLSQFVMQRNKTAKIVSMKALRGTYRFFSGNSAKSAYKISTSSATIGIRGTVFDFWVKKKTGAVVFEGAVDLAGRDAGLVRVNQGCEMGEATLNSARVLLGAEKTKTILDNLPFIADQSQLQPGFQANVTNCNL
jgi:hypothetical protein